MLTEGSQDISFDAMKQRQQAVADVLLKDPNVAGFMSFVGAGLGNPALTRGLTKIRNFDHEGQGLLAVERYDPETGRRVLVAFNTSGEAITRNVEIDYRATGIATLLGTCRAAVTAPGAVTLTIPAFGYVACELEMPGGEG